MNGYMILPASLFCCLVLLLGYCTELSVAGIDVVTTSEERMLNLIKLN